MVQPIPWPSHGGWKPLTAAIAGTQNKGTVEEPGTLGEWNPYMP